MYCDLSMLIGIYLSVQDIVFVLFQILIENINLKWNSGYIEKYF